MMQESLQRQPSTPPASTQPRAGRVDDSWADSFLGAMGGREIPWERLRNRPLTLRERQAIRLFYSAEYPIRCDYTKAHPWHTEQRKWQILVAQNVFGDLGKCLDAGCSAGALVQIARANGINCHGFDICPDLHEICYPDVKAHLRIGDFANVPFSRSDGFRTCLSYDVIEHVPIDHLELFPAELSRLGIRQLAFIIATDTISEGHITIQDTAWYEALFARYGYRLLHERTDSLRGIRCPVAWDHENSVAHWRNYEGSGSPPNGWNRAPGYLFFEKR